MVRENVSIASTMMRKVTKHPKTEKLKGKPASMGLAAKISKNVNIFLKIYLVLSRHDPSLGYFGLLSSEYLSNVANFSKFSSALIVSFMARTLGFVW